MTYDFIYTGVFLASFYETGDPFVDLFKVPLQTFRDASSVRVDQRRDLA